MMRARPAIALAVLLLIELVTVPAASAEPGLIVLGGTVTTTRERATVRSAVEAAARSAGWSLAAVAKRDADALLACQDVTAPSRCVPEAVRSLGIERILVITIDHAQSRTGAPMIVITGKALATDVEAVALRRRYCEQCSNDALGQASTELATDALQTLAARASRTVIEIRSQPAGTDISLDGVKVGGTEVTFNTYPGKHVVVVTKPGFVSETREVTISAGKTASLSFVLQPVASVETTPTPPQRERPGSLGPLLTIGAGAALIVAGAVSVYYGERDGPEYEFKYTRATPIGAVSIGLGLSAVAVGVYWRRHRSRSMPVVEASASGVISGWSWQF